MFRFFSFKKKQNQKENNVNSLVVKKLDRIIELLEQKQKESTVRNIHFDHVKIDHLENIVFRLDNIEIDELSGKLVIGNNIRSSEELAQSIISNIDKKKAKKEAQSETASHYQEQMQKTPKGFRLRNNL
jgi:hypothetical protein